MTETTVIAIKAASGVVGFVGSLIVWLYKNLMEKIDLLQSKEMCNQREKSSLCTIEARFDGVATELKYIKEAVRDIKEAVHDIKEK